MINDAYVSSSLELQDWIATDHARVRSAFNIGALLVGLRKGCESLCEVHERIGVNRACPEKYGICKHGVWEVDEYLRQLSSIGDIPFQEGRPARPCVVDLPVGPSDLFEEGLGRVLKHGDLSAENADLLNKAIEVAKYHGGTPLRFGHIYDYLVRQHSLLPESDLVQWCRTAYSIAVPGNLKIPFVSGARDLDVQRLFTVMDASPREAEDPARLQEMWPARILTLAALDGLDFGMIAAHRIEGEKLGYFAAVADLHAALWSDAFESKFVRFLELLAMYLKAIGREAKVELVPRAKVLAQAKLENDEAAVKRALWAIPIAVGFLVGGLLTQVTLNPVPLVVGCITAGGVVSAGLTHFRDAWCEKRPPLLKRMLEDTLAFAPSPRSTSSRVAKGAEPAAPLDRAGMR